MKKLVFVFLIALLVLTATSCHRDMCPGTFGYQDQHSAICKK